MKKIWLSNDGFIIVSDEDYIYLQQYKWCYNKGSCVQGRVKGKTTYMHRLVAERAGINCSKELDHINNDPLDNRRENLRSGTPSQVRANKRKYKNNTSGFKGVFSCRKKWRAGIRVDNKLKYLGVYSTREEAHIVYCKAAEHYFGEFANSGKDNDK